MHKDVSDSLYVVSIRYRECSRKKRERNTHYISSVDALLLLLWCDFQEICNSKISWDFVNLYRVYSVYYTLFRIKWNDEETERTEREAEDRKKVHTTKTNIISRTHELYFVSFRCTFWCCLCLYIYIHISLFTLILLWPFWVLFFAFAPYIRQNTLSLLSEYSLKFKLFFLLSFLVGNWISSKKRPNQRTNDFLYSICEFFWLEFSCAKPYFPLHIFSCFSIFGFLESWNSIKLMFRCVLYGWLLGKMIVQTYFCLYNGNFLSVLMYFSNDFCCCLFSARMVTDACLSGDFKTQHILLSLRCGKLFSFLKGSLEFQSAFYFVTISPNEKVVRQNHSERSIHFVNIKHLSIHLISLLNAIRIYCMQANVSVNFLFSGWNRSVWLTIKIVKHCRLCISFRWNGFIN